MNALRWIFLAQALACLALAFRQQQRPLGDAVIVFPVAPPLTRISSLGDAPLGPAPGLQGPPPQGPPPQGPPPQGPPPDGATPAGPTEPLGHALRVAVQADAINMAQVLGPQRVAWAVDQREALSASMGEGAVWEQLQALLEAP